jgi:hypothetical protein
MVGLFIVLLGSAFVRSFNLEAVLDKLQSNPASS